MTTKYQNFTVNYFLSRGLFFGIGFSLIIGLIKQDSILSFILGTLIGTFLIFLINKVHKFKKDKTLDQILTEMKALGVFIRILLILFALALLAEGITFFQLFVSSFILNKSPLYFISLPIIVLILKISQGGVKTTFRVASCLFPISFALTFFSLLVLFQYADFNNVVPLFQSKPYYFIKATFYYVSLAVSPSILMLVTNKSDSKSTLLSYLLGSFTLTLKVFLIIAIVGPILAYIYRFPEYVILKEIKLLDFIEKIENIVSLSWIFDQFIFLSVASVFMKELLPKKAQSISHSFLIILVYLSSFLFLGKYYTIEILLYYTIPLFVFIIFILTIPPLLIYTYKNK